MVTTRPPKTIVKPTALGPVANTDTKLLIYGLFKKGRVLAQDGVAVPITLAPTVTTGPPRRTSTGLQMTGSSSKPPSRRRRRLYRLTCRCSPVSRRRSTGRAIDTC